MRVEAEKLSEQNGGVWGEHPVFTPDQWRLDVANHDTRLGYWDWVVAMIEAQQDA